MCRESQIPLVILVLCYLLMLLILLLRARHSWPHSPLFSADPRSVDMARKALELNDKRTEQAEEYMKGVPVLSGLRDTNALTSQDPPVIAIGVITTKRENSDVWRLQYLTQTVAAIHKQVNADRYFQKKVLFICNVDPHPELYNESQHLQRLVESVDRFSGKEVPDMHRPEDLFEKEKHDYTFCMESALAYDPEYVLLLQDDAVVVEGFFDVMHSVLHRHILQEHTAREDEHNGVEWFSLKFYHPEKWQGFASNFQSMTELCGFAILGGCAFVAFVLYFHPLMCHVRLRRRHVLYFSIGAIYALTVVLCLGRPSVMAIWTLSPHLYRVVPDPGCCIPAVLYQKHHLAGLIDFLKQTRCHIDFPIDLAIDRHISMTDSTGYLVEPNAVTHVGMLSSLRPGLKVASEFL